MISLPNATASLGQAFSYDLKPYLRNTSEVASLNITISPSSNYTEWISVDQSNFQLSGTPPNQTSALTKRFKHRGRVMYRRADEAQAFVRITAMDAATDLISTATLNLGLAGLPGAAIPSPTSSITPTNSSTSLGDGKKSGGLSSGAKIALGVVFGLVGAALLAGLILFCCIRRRKQSKNGNKEKTRKSTDSFTGIIKSPNAEKTPFRPGGFSLFGAPPNLPRSESAKLQNGELPEFNSIYIQRPSAEGDSTPVRAVVQDGAERPVQMGMLAGILRKSSYDKRNSNGSHHSVPGLEFPSPVPGEIIRQDSLLHPGEPSDFTHSFGSSSDDRASWESRETFQWSSAEGAQTTYLAANGRPLSSAPSIPRPRNDFTPRYPRNPLAASMVRPPSDTFSGHTFSEFHDHIGSQDHSADSLTHTGSGTGTTSFATHTHSHSGSGTISGITETSSSLNGAHEAATRVPAGYSHGPSALGKIIGESGHFAPVEEEEEEEGYSDESAVLALAQRHSLEQPDIHRAPRLMPSRERFAAQSPTNDQASVASHTPSQEAIAVNNDAFDDADEEGPRDRASTAYAPSDLTGLGYPAEAIIFGDRSSQAFSSDGKRVVSIRAIPAKDVVLSPPLPQFGSMAQPTNPRAYAARRPISTGSALHDGRYIAQTNETFNLHPHIDPPPQVSLSAATWSAPAPSTYRIESSDGSALPSWLHWDGKELELWGIPALGDAGQIINVKVVERIPKPKRKSYDSSQLIPEEITEREVGSCIIE
jgi:axial budding pattern protein 2